MNLIRLSRLVFIKGEILASSTLVRKAILKHQTIEMDMSMSMSTTVMTGMSMDMSTTVSSAMSSMTGMAMDMATSSSSAHNHAGMTSTSAATSATSSMDMDMSSSSMKMSMNSYLTRSWKNYPVVFHKLYAKEKKDAFGIFVLILTAAFVYKFLLFVSWCLEVHWFKKWNQNKKSYQTDSDDYVSDDELTETGDGQTILLPKLPNLMYDIFAPSWRDLLHDSIRILLVFCSTMIIYMLMLVAMTYVLSYVFAVITGLALSEVFYNRCKISMLRRWNIQREIEKARNCPGGSNCKCGRHTHNQENNSTDVDSANYEEKAHDNQTNTNSTEQCICEPDAHSQDRMIERNISENARQQEQSNNMDTNLLPADKFT